LTALPPHFTDMLVAEPHGLRRVQGAPVSDVTVTLLTCECSTDQLAETSNAPFVRRRVNDASYVCGHIGNRVMYRPLGA
jgi:hypothetical protein